MDGTEVDQLTPDENIFLYAVNELLHIPLVIFKDVHENNEFLSFCFSIYNLDTEEVNNLLEELESLPDLTNSYLEMNRDLFKMVVKIRKYIFYQKIAEAYMRKLESKNLKLISIRKLGDKNLSKYID